MSSVGSSFRWLLAPSLGALLSQFASVQIASEPTQPTGSMGLACRKDRQADDEGWVAEAATAETLGTLINTHSDEAVALSSDEPSLERFSALLEDRVTGSRERMDPRLLQLLRSLAIGRAPARLELVSGYRSWKLNEMLRKKGRRVASHSQHSRGMALDFRIVGISPQQLHDAIESAGWKGGIGTYSGLGDRFVHADTGPDRRWVGH
jgi:uncharacterized protein YcbK (DUF882 family)